MGKYPREYITMTVSQNPTAGGQGESATPLARKGTDIILLPRQEVVGLVRGLVSRREQVYIIPHVSHTCNKQELGPPGGSIRI